MVRARAPSVTVMGATVAEAKRIGLLLEFALLAKE
jgi:hypothetical protein